MDLETAMTTFGGQVNEARVDVWRGGLVESSHLVSVAVVDATGRLRAGVGDPSRVTWARSVLKPVQALAVVEGGVADAFGWEAAELALCCASHSGEARHVERVAAMLASLGLEESALACGPQTPQHGPAAEALRASGGSPGRIHNNCSGKHAGMLGLARLEEWPVAGYEKATHAVQQRVLEEVARWTGRPQDDMPLATDGCGVPTFALPLQDLAAAFARIAGAARAGNDGPARIVRAMTSWPELVAGTDRLCTELMRATHGRIFAKVGAEGGYCAGIPGAEIGIALKVDDGSNRAAQPALLAVLESLSLVSEAELAALESFAEPAVTNTRGERVGHIRASLTLEALA